MILSEMEARLLASAKDRMAASPDLPKNFRNHLLVHAPSIGLKYLLWRLAFIQVKLAQNVDDVFARMSTGRCLKGSIAPQRGL